jgi:CHRD domain
MGGLADIPFSLLNALALHTIKRNNLPEICISGALARSATEVSMSRYSTLFIAAGAALIVGCETVERTATEAVGNNFSATLTGANEVPPADPDGTGTARISIDDVTNRICTHLEVRDIGAVTAAHIHRGNTGVNGPPVVTLDAPDDDDSDDCDDVADELVDEIRRSPGSFYVNVHTADHPDGAIRGQVFNVQG